MIVKQLDNLRKKDSYLYYRNDYCADAVFEYGKNSNTEKASVEFSIEKTAIGDTKINVLINSSINYPMLPAMKTLKAFVMDMQTEGSLP
ncbi:MAG: hypothetical protein RBT69_06175 [Spirochaetia bacterium]|jgi:hypothetical protein|nr:hypothetical protein [Spirochaetia bacterium]